MSNSFGRLFASSQPAAATNAQISSAATTWPGTLPPPPPQPPAPDVYVVDERHGSDIGESLLLPVPIRLRDRILRGEYIDLDDLLPENLSDQTPDSLELQSAIGEGTHRQLT